MFMMNAAMLNSKLLAITAKPRNRATANEETLSYVSFIKVNASIKSVLPRPLFMVTRSIFTKLFLGNVAFLKVLRQKVRFNMISNTR